MGKDSSSNDSADFATILAFFEKFGDQCGIVERPDSKKLQQMLDNCDDVCPELVDLHVKLLRKIRKIVHLDKWERALAKFCYTYSNQDAWEIERFGYKKSSLSVKLRVLKALCETQFDLNTKFKTAINLVSAAELRSEPIGHDKQGNAYWCFINAKCNLKVYQENADDETWQIVANSREEMVQLIQKLKGNVPIKPLVDDLVDEDTSSMPPKLETPVKVEESSSKITEPEKAKFEHSDDEYKEVDDDPSDAEESPGKKPKVVSPKRQAEPEVEKPKAEVQKVAPKLLLKPKKPVEEYSDEEMEEEETDISDEDEPPLKQTGEASAMTPTKTKITLKPPAKPQEEYSDEEDEYSDEESEYSDEEVAQPTPSKRPQIIIKPGRLGSSPQKPAAEPKPAAVVKKQPPVPTKNDDTADSEADYDDLEEEEIEEEESDISEVGEAIVEPVMHVKGAGSGKDNKCGNLEPEFSEIVEEELLFVFGEGTGSYNEVGNPGKGGEETENGEKVAVPAKPMFFFGQPGCLKNSPVKSSPNLSPMFGGEPSVLNFGEKVRESINNKLEQEPPSVEENKPVSETVEPTPQSTSEPVEPVPEPASEAPPTAALSVEDDKTNGKQAPPRANDTIITNKNPDEPIEQPTTSTAQPQSPPRIEVPNKVETVVEKSEGPVPGKEEPLVKEADSPKTDVAEGPLANDKEPRDEIPKTTNEPEVLLEKKVESEIGEDLSVARVPETPPETKPEVPATIVESKTPEIPPPEKLPVEPKSSRAKKSLNLNAIARNLANTAEEKEQAHLDMFEGASKFHKIGKVRAKIDVPPRGDPLPSPVEPEKKIELTEKRTEEVTPTKPATPPEKVEKSPEFSKSKPFKAQILEKFSSSNEKAALAKKEPETTPPKSTPSPPVSHSVSQMLNATKPRKAQILEKFSYEMKSKEQQSRNAGDAQPADLSRPKEEATDLSKKPSPNKAAEYPTKYSAAASSTFRPSDHSILSLTGGQGPAPREAHMSEKTTTTPFNSLEQLSNLVSVYKTINTNRQGMSKTTEIIQKVDYGPVEASQPQEMPNTSVSAPPKRKLEASSPPSSPEVQSVRLEPSKTVPEQMAKLARVEKPEAPVVLEVIIEEVKVECPPTPKESKEVAKVDPPEPVKKEERTETVKEEAIKPVETVKDQPEVVEKRRGRFKAAEKPTPEVKTPEKPVEEPKPEVKTPEKVEKKLKPEVKTPENVVKAEPPKLPETEKKQEKLEEPKPTAPEKVVTPDEPKEAKLAATSRKRGASKITEKVDVAAKETTEKPASDSGSSKEAGGKRVKLRQKRQSPPNKQLRKTVEQRKNEERSSSSDEEDKATEPPKKGGRPKKATAAATSKTQRTNKTEVAASSKASTESPNEFIGFDEDEIATSTINRKQIEEEKERKEKEKAAKTTPKGRQAKTSVEKDPLQADTKEEAAKSDENDKTPKKFKHLIRQLDTSLVIQTQDNEAPVRTSRRIAQLKIREEADRRKMEEQLLKQMKAECVKKKRQAGADDDTQNDDAGEDKSSDFKPSDDDEDSKDTEKQKRKKKSKKDNPWQTDSDDDAEKSAAEEEEREREEPEDYRLPDLKSDHEFSPESDIEEGQAVPTKRARTVKKEPKVDAESSEEEFSAEHTCQKCGKTDHPEWILLCDSCDHGWHCSCLTPVLFVIPEGDWFCPLCQHKKLIDNLETQLIEYDKRLRQMELEEARKKRLELEEIEKLEKAAQEKEKREKEKEMRKKEKRESGAKRSRRRLSSSGSGSGSESETESDASSKKRKKAAKPKSPVKAKSEREKKAATESEGSESESARSQSSATNSSDDEPIYKLRRRNQNNVSYRFNAYDELINLAIKKDEMEVDDSDAIVASVFGDANAGNEGRGKDISTIMEADKEETKVVQPRVGKGKQMGDSEDEEVEELEKEEARKSGGKHMTSSDSDEPIAAVMKKVKKKKKRLNCLDINSDESDASDESFKGGTPDSEDEETDLSNASESSLENCYRKRNSKSGKRKMRASTRKREKRYDHDFIDDESSDNSKSRRRGKKKSKGGRKKEYDPLDDENDDDDDEESLDSEDVDSEDLCDDTTDSSGSEMGWRKKKKKKGGNRGGGGKGASTPSGGGGGKQMPGTPKTPVATVKRKVKKVDENDKSFRAGVSTKKLKKPEKSESDSDDQPIRRTRGRQMHYTEEDYFESSDDGIKPGVKRPDTPPEEREKFIKRQEEIKRMLAEKNVEAAKQLAAPKLDGVKTPTKVGGVPVPSDSLSTVPLQVIEGAKELDPEFLKPSKNNSISELSGAFDNLPEDFNPEDMDEEELAKMMEEEDFAQHQLKLAGEAIARKKKEGASLAMVLDEKEIIKDMPDDINKPPKLTKAGAEVKKRGRKIKTELDGPLAALKPSEAAPPLTAPVTKPPLSHGPPPPSHHYPPGLHPPPPGHGQHSFLSQQLQQHLKPHPMSGHHPGHPPAHMSMPPHQQRHPMMMAQHYRHPMGPGMRHPHHPQGHPGGSGLPQPPYLIHQPNRHMGPYGPPPTTSHHLPYNASSGPPPPSSTATSQPQMPSHKPPPMPAAPPVPSSSSSVSSLEAMIPTTVLSVSQQSALAPMPKSAASTAPLQTATGGDSGTADKKRGRRKKITPLRDDLPQADPAQSLLQMKPEFAEKMGLKTPGGPVAQPVVPLETSSASGSAGASSKLAVAPPPQLFNPSTIGSGSVITRLLQPQRPSMFRGSNDPQPRYLAPPPSKPPTASHLPPDHYLGPQPPHPLYRGQTPPSSIFGSPSARMPGAPPGYHPGAGGPPPLGKPIRGSLPPPQEYQNPYPPQFAGYYPPPPTQPQQLTVATHLPTPLHPQISPNPHRQSYSPQNPQHPTPFESAKATVIASPQHAPPSPAATLVTEEHPPAEEPASSSEFSGLVSYFSSQHDDLDT